MKICPVGAQFFHADGRRDRHGLLGKQAHRQVDMTKLIVIIRKCAKAPKSVLCRKYAASTRGNPVPCKHITRTLYDAAQNANHLICRTTEHFAVPARVFFLVQPAICWISTAESDRNVIQMFCKQFPHACSSNYCHLFHLRYIACHTFVYFKLYHYYHYKYHNRQNCFYLVESV